MYVLLRLQVSSILTKSKSITSKLKPYNLQLSCFFFVDECVTSKPFKPATTFACPDICPKEGPHFSGNLPDPHQPRQYVACWKGVTVGCITCPQRLIFNRRWNACLYEGNSKQIPPGRTDLDYPGLNGRI